MNFNASAADTSGRAPSNNKPQSKAASDWRPHYSSRFRLPERRFGSSMWTGAPQLSSPDGQTERCDVNGAGQKREAQDNVEDRCQNNFPNKRLARHTRRSALQGIDDTFLASRGTGRFNLLPEIIGASQF